MTDHEKYKKMIELQLGDLSERNIMILHREMESLLYGQAKKVEVEEKIQRDALRKTYDIKSFVGGKIITQKLPIPPAGKKKRPRIIPVSNNMEVMISTIGNMNNSSVDYHMEQLRKLNNEHNSSQ